MLHSKVDICCTDSADLITIPEWVERAKYWDGNEYVSHPLASRAGDLLLTNELHYLDASVGEDGVPKLILPDGTPPPHIFEYLRKDIEADARGDSAYREVDITVEPTVFSETDNPTIDDSIRSAVQEIIMRVRTNSPDLIIHPEIGANLEDLLGQWQTRKVANWGLDNIVTQLKEISGMEITDAQVLPIDNMLNFITKMAAPNYDLLTMSIRFSFEDGFIVQGGTFTVV